MSLSRKLQDLESKGGTKAAGKPVLISGNQDGKLPPEALRHAPTSAGLNVWYKRRWLSFTDWATANFKDRIDTSNHPLNEWMEKSSAAVTAAVERRIDGTTD